MYVLIRPVDRKEFERRTFPHVYDVLIYQEAGHIYAKDSNGNVICSDSPTACIQESINYVTNLGGGKVFIKNGIYNIGSTINMPNGDLNLIIEGESMSTVLKVNSEIDVFNFYVDQANRYISHVYIENFKILGNVDNHIGTAFKFDVYTADNKLRYIGLVTVKNVVIHGVNRGIYARNLWMARFEDLEIQYSGVSNPIIYLDQYPGVDSTHDVYFNRLYIENVNTIPIYVADNVYDINIHKCFIDPIYQVPYDIYFTDYSARNRVEGCYLSRGTQYAVRTGLHTVIIGNIMIDIQGGIEVGFDESLIIGNIILPKTYGIYVSGRINNSIIGNKIYGGNTGIFLYSGSNYTVIIGNTVRDTNQHGIYIYQSDHVILKGNSILNPSAFEPNRYSGIYISGGGSNLIDGNIILGNNMLYSVLEDSTNNNIIINNLVNKPMNIVGLNTIVRYNHGYITSNSGLATISANSTRVTVSHGLANAPTKVLITPLASPPGKLWVENITATSFDIVTDTAPTANLTIAWYAEV